MAASGDNAANTNFIGLTAEIVSAYVGNNSVAQGDIPALISQSHQALLRVASGQVEAASEPLKPAVPVNKSNHADNVVCI
jgi:predicted transcriptional regulator